MTKATILHDLRSLGLQSGALILVHSSLGSLGWVEGGADAVIDALVVAVSPGGIVLVPTLTGSAQLGPTNPPVFDPRTSPCWTGVIPETFRRRPTAVRSRHPTHSVAAIGPLAGELIARHEYCATPCARDSPYGRLADLEGSILLLGVTHDSNTCLHMLEEIVDAPYHLQEQASLARVRRPDGSWEEIATRLHLYGYERNFPRIETLLLSRGAQTERLVAHAHAKLVNATMMRDLVVPLLEADRLYLLSEEGRRLYRAGTWNAPGGACDGGSEA